MLYWREWRYTLDETKNYFIVIILRWKSSTSFQNFMVQFFCHNTSKNIPLTEMKRSSFKSGGYKSFNYNFGFHKWEIFAFWSRFSVNLIYLLCKWDAWVLGQLNKCKKKKLLLSWWNGLVYYFRNIILKKKILNLLSKTCLLFEQTVFFLWCRQLSKVKLHIWLLQWKIIN